MTKEHKEGTFPMAGPGEDTGGMAIVRVDAPAPDVPDDDDLVALAERVRAFAVLAPQAMDGGTDTERVYLARHARDLAEALERAAATDQVRRAVWQAGYEAGLQQCPAPARGPRHAARRERPDYLKPLAAFAPAAFGVFRLAGRHTPAHSVGAAATKATILAGGTAAAASVLIFSGAMSNQPYETHLYVPPAATVSPAAQSLPPWMPPAGRRPVLPGSQLGWPVPAVTSVPPQQPVPPSSSNPAPVPTPTDTGTAAPADTGVPAPADTGAAAPATCPAPAAPPAPAPTGTTGTSAYREYTGLHRNPVAAAI
jgi:hypothetical protein